MKPTVSFVLMNRDGGPFDAAWRAIEAQSLPSNQLDVHVLSPVSGATPAVPSPSGETIVFLGSPVIPASDLASLAHARLDEADNRARAVLQGRATAADEITDPVSRRVINGAWCDYGRVTDPEHVPFYWIDPRCLVLTSELFTEIGPILIENAFAPRASRARLGLALTRDHRVELRVRPRLRVYEPSPTTIDAALERARIESAARYAVAVSDASLARRLGIPPHEELTSGDPATHHRRVERLSEIARELAKLDLPHIMGSEPPDVPATEQIERLTDEVLRRASSSVAHMAWIVASHERDETVVDAARRRTAAYHVHGKSIAESFAAAQSVPHGQPDESTSPETRELDQIVAEGGDAPSLHLTPRSTDAPLPTHSSREDAPALSLTPGERLFTAGPPSTAERSDPDVSIIIVATDAAETLPECLAAIDAQTLATYEIIVVDNGSIDETATIARNHRTVHMVLPLTEPVGYGEGANLATRVARGRYIVLLEPDAVPCPGWAHAMIAKVTDGVAAVGPVSNGLSGPQSLVRWLDRFTVLDDVSALVQSLAESASLRGSASRVARWLQPLCILLPRAALTEIGSFHGQLATADAATMDLALRISKRRGKMVIATDAFVARAGGMRRSPTSTYAPGAAGSESEQVREDMVALREMFRGASRVPTSRELWGVELAGFDGAHKGPRMSIVIPVCNQLDFTKACLDSLRNGTINDAEIIVVDNGSTDGTADYIAARGDVVVLRNEENQGFAPAANQGLRRARGREILVLNNDVIVPKRMLERLIAALDRNPAYDMIGPVSNYAAPSQQIEASYADIEDLDGFADSRWAQHGPTLRPEPVVLGLAMLMRREVLETVGGFDERFEVGNFEDNDFSLRATVAGYRLGVADGVYIHHFGGRTFAGEGFDYQALLRTNHARFVDKWQRQETPSELAPATSAVAPAAPAEWPPARSARAAHVSPVTDHGEPSLVRPETVEAPGWLPLDATETVAASPTAEQGEVMDQTDRTQATGRWAERDREDAIAAGAIGASSPPNGDSSAPNGDSVQEPGESDVQLAPGDIYLVANDRLEKGLFEEAEQLFAWTIEQMPEMVLAHMGRGLALARLGRLEEAASALEHTVRLEPTLSEGYNNLGVVYYMMNRLDQARRALQRGVELDPENAEARANLEEISARVAASQHSASA